MRTPPPPGTGWYGKKQVCSAQSPDAAAVDVAWLATRPAGVTEPYGELVQHRVVLGYDAR